MNSEITKIVKNIIIYVFNLHDKNARYSLNLDNNSEILPTERLLMCCSTLNRNNWLLKCVGDNPSSIEKVIMSQNFEKVIISHNL